MTVRYVRSTILAGVLSLLAFGASPAIGKDKDAPATPAQVQQVYGCRDIADAAERLACFDRQVAALQQGQ